jgi:hypothetical protein
MSAQTSGLIPVPLSLTILALLFGSLSPPRLAARSADDTVSVEINAQSDIPLKIANAAATSTASGLQSLHYTLVNQADQRLLAVEIVWTLHFANGASLRTENRQDFAFDFEGKLGPGDSDNTDHLDSVNATRHPSPVRSVTGEIAFAQFADGTTLGSERGKVLPWLKDQRSASLNEYRQLIQVYRSGGETALAQALAAESGSETIRGRADRRALLQLQRQNGITAVETQLNRVASLKLPE